MFDVGRVCLKIAGRDSNKYCVIVKKIDEVYVEVDGQTRRKKVNVRHLEPTKILMDIKEGADHSIIVEAFAKHDIKIAVKKSKKATERPKKAKIIKEKPVKEKKPEPVKKEASKEKVIAETKLEKTLEAEEEKVEPKQEVKKEEPLKKEEPKAEEKPVEKKAEPVKKETPKPVEKKEEPKTTGDEKKTEPIKKEAPKTE